MPDIPDGDIPSENAGLSSSNTPTEGPSLPVRADSPAFSAGQTPIDPGMPAGPQPPTQPRVMTERVDVPEAPDIPDAVEPTNEPTAGLARRVVVTSARVITGAIGVGVAALAIAAAAWLPLPSHTAIPRAVTVTPVSAAQQRVCAGPILRLGNEAGEDATTVSSVGRPTIRYSQTAGRATASQLATTDNTSSVAPEVITLPAATGSQGILSGAQSQSVDSGDLTGFTSAECAEGSSDSWLVGGSTSTGRTSLLSLANSGEVPATVTLTIYSESGVLTAAGTDGIVVPANGQRVLSLAGFAPNAASPVIHVESRGGLVVASLQQSTVRTLDPGGIDIVQPTGDPSTTAIIPGITIADSDSVAALEPQPGYSDLKTIIRLLVPGSVAAKAEITIAPEAVPGTAAIGEPTTVEVTLTAGVVTDVPLDSFPDGSYTVTIHSDRPVLAGAQVSTVGSTGQNDFAWLAAAPVMKSLALVSIAPGPTPTLHLDNPTTKDTSVILHVQGQADTTITVPAGSSIAQPVVAGTTYRLSGFSGLAASVGYLGDGQLASYPVTPSAPASTPITIYP